MFLARWRARRANRVLIDHIHGEIVAAARAPVLYADFGVPDDLDGRFEMVTLHAGLVLRRIAEFGDGGAGLAGEIVDRVFQGFEDAFREMSISDVGVVKRIKKMLEAFHGRSKVYGEALAANDSSALAAALARNAYRDSALAESARARALADHVFALAAALESVPVEAFTQGRFRFSSLTGGAA